MWVATLVRSDTLYAIISTHSDYCPVVHSSNRFLVHVQAILPSLPASWFSVLCRIQPSSQKYAIILTMNCVWASGGRSKLETWLYLGTWLQTTTCTMDASVSKRQHHAWRIYLIIRLPEKLFWDSICIVAKRKHRSDFWTTHLETKKSLKSNDLKTLLVQWKNVCKHFFLMLAVYLDHETFWLYTCLYLKLFVLLFRKQDFTGVLPIGYVCISFTRTETS